MVLPYSDFTFLNIFSAYIFIYRSSDFRSFVRKMRRMQGAAASHEALLAGIYACLSAEQRGRA